LVTYTELGEPGDGQIEIRMGGGAKTLDVISEHALGIYQVSFDGLQKENIIDIKYPLECPAPR
jgi:hypothetical protein